jgi:formyl-CoA transferase
VLNAPIQLSTTPATIRRRAPQLGEHSVEVLTDHGFDQGRITEPADRGVIA